MTALRIALVYPDLLGTYGDSGNAEILFKRATWRGIEAELLACPSSEALPEADLYAVGGAEDGPQALAAERLMADGGLGRAVEAGAVIFAVCAGYQVLGHHFAGPGGERYEGVGILDVTTERGSGERAVGEVVVEPASSLGLPLLSGFENHGAVTTLGPAASPLGRAISGVGNGGGDGSEGAKQGRILGTYLHGPVLARNPELGDLLLRWALEVDELQALDDVASQELRRERLAASGH